jgi:hypothetical protein
MLHSLDWDIAAPALAQKSPPTKTRAVHMGMAYIAKREAMTFTLLDPSRSGPLKSVLPHKKSAAVSINY